MGVHITFVRSVDLDEWTQRQIDSMRIGGNDNCKKFFRKHGTTDFHTKTEKKYTSKAAVAYRAELAKLVEAEAAKRGEGVSTGATGEGGSSVLDNADATMKRDMEDEARSKVNAARANGAGGSSAGTLQPSAKLASQMSGTRGRLSTPGVTPTPTPPASGGLSTNGFKKLGSSTGGPKLVLRKPSTTSASSRLLKKGSSLSTASKLRVNRITTPSSSTMSGDDAFEDVETTQKNIENQKKKEGEDKKRREEEDAKLARELQEQLNGLGNGDNNAAAAAASTNGGAAPAMNGTEPATPTPTPASGIIASSAAPKPKVNAHEANMKKLSAMNSDFFSGM